MTQYTLFEINQSIDLCATLHLDDFKLPGEHTSADDDLLLLVEQRIFRPDGQSDRERAISLYHRSLNL